MNRLIDAVALAIAVRDAAQAGTGQQTDAARDDGSLVADDVTEQVAGNDDTVQGTRVLDHDHRRAVDQLVLQLQLGELLLEYFSDDLPPQAAGREHVGLVQAPDLGRRVAREGQEATQTSDPLNLLARVGLGVEGETRAIVLLAIAEVDAASELTNDDKVSAAADFGLQGGAVDEEVRGEAAWAQVAEGAELLAQLQEALLGADGRRRSPFRTANGAQKDGIGSLGGSEGLIGQGNAMLVDGSLTRR